MKNFRFLFLFSIFCFLFFALANAANAATLFLAPSLGSFGVGTTFSVGIKVNTEGKSINTAEATLTFDPTKIEVVNISKTGSIFSLWVSEPTFSNTDGIISFAGGKPSPGYTGSSGTLITVMFKGKTTGVGNLNFSSASVLADDGLGTNILSSLISGAYTITTKEIITAPSPAVPGVPAASSNAPAAPVIVSPNFPEEDKWYSDNSPEFFWQLPSGVTGVSLMLTQEPGSNPGLNSDGLLESKKFEDVENGIWYFHIKFRNSYGWGPITHRKVLIDTIPPTIFKVIIDKKSVLTNPSPVLYFESTDIPSGIEYYEVVIDREKKALVQVENAAIADIAKNPFQMPLLEPGAHLVEVKAFDKAGNFSLTEAEIEITPIESPEITKIPARVGVGELLSIKGTALPEITVRIYLQRGTEEPILEKVQADLEGNFIFTYDKDLAEGSYKVWAQSEDEIGALSYPTKDYSLTVGLPVILKFGKIALDYTSMMITLIVLIIGGIFVGFYAWYRISIWRKKLRQETKEVAENIAKAFKALREEVEEQIELLDGKPGLNKDERKVRNKLKEALNISEEFISKEVEDVEKELE